MLGPSPYPLAQYHSDREYLIELLGSDDVDHGLTYVYHDSLKDALLDAVDMVDHFHTTERVDWVRLHHKGQIVAEFQVFPRTSHYVGTTDGFVARYDPEHPERARKARYTSRFVIAANKKET